tara:strand:- start:26 stop:910 length:885 start_codon:yes stop_codon:yes gene_type:complete
MNNQKGWKLTEPPETKLVTMNMAERLRDMPAAPSDRALSQHRLKAYRKILEQGKFRPVTWAVAYCQETRLTYRVNGKHTSNLIAECDEVPEFYATIERYSCERLDDVARLYSTFDTRISSRTTGDINLTFAGTIPALSGYQSRFISLATTGLSIAKWGLSYSVQPAIDRAELLLEFKGFVVWLHSIITGENTPYHLRRTAVVAAMFRTWSIDREAATVFWTAVRNETGQQPKLPDRVLAKWLTSNSTKATRGANARKASVREFLVRSIHGWNAWRAGKSTKLKYTSTDDIPECK